MPVQKIEGRPRADRHKRFFSFQPWPRALVAVRQRASGRIVTTTRLIGKHEEVAGQLVRYALTGGLASVVNIGVYWVLAANGMDPNLAWTIGFAAAVLVGYVVHSRWSFRGHGRRDNLARTGGRFVAVVAGQLRAQPALGLAAGRAFRRCRSGRPIRSCWG